MPPSKLSPEQRSAELARQSHEKLQKADTLLVSLAMKTHGGPAVNACKNNLVALGFIDPTTNKIVQPCGAAVPYRANMVAGQASLANVPAKPLWNQGLGSTWDACDLKKIRSFMSQVDGVSMSDANIKRCLVLH